MNKKGIALSFNVIIIAIISLLVLVIVVYLLAGSSSDLKDGTACPKQGGRCMETNACPDEKQFRDTTCGEGNTFVCCSLVPIRDATS